MKCLHVIHSRAEASHRRGNERHVFLIITSISRTEHQAHLKRLRLHLFMTSILLNYFPSNNLHFNKVHIRCFMVRVSASQISSRTGWSVVSSKAGMGTQLSEMLKKRWNVCFKYWLWLPWRAWIESLTTATVGGTLALYSYLATAFSPAIEVISRLGYVCQNHTRRCMFECHTHSWKQASIWSIPFLVSVCTLYL